MKILTSKTIMRNYTPISDFRSGSEIVDLNLIRFAFWAFDPARTPRLGALRHVKSTQTPFSGPLKPKLRKPFSTESLLLIDYGIAST